MKAFHSNRQHFICKSKVKYTNIKSAERAKKALSNGYGKKHSIYKCGESKHYHLTTKPQEVSNPTGGLNE